MGVVGEISEDIYKASGGEVGYKFVSPDLKESGHEISEAAGRYVFKNTQTQENAIYDNQKRVEKIRNVMSIVMDDHVHNSERNRYDRLINNPNLAKDLGFTNQAQNSANKMLSNGVTSVGTAGTIINAGTLSNTEMIALMKTGQFTRNINGNQQVFTVNGTDRATVMHTLENANKEKKQFDNIFDAKGTKDKIAAVSKMRQASIAKLKNEGIDIGSGSTCAIRKAEHNLLKEKHKAQSRGDVTTVATIDNKLNKIKEHHKKFDGSENAVSHRDSHKKSAFRMMERSMEGSDFGDGIQHIRNAKNNTVMAVKIVRHAPGAINYNIAKHIPGVKNSKIVEKWGNRREVKAQRRNRSCKQKRADRFEKIKELRIKGAGRRETRYENRQTNLRAKGKTEAADRRKRRHDRRDRRNGAIAGMLGNVKTGFGKFTGGLKNIKDKIFNNRLMKIIKAPANAIGWAIEKIKKLFVKYIAIPIGFLLIFITIILSICDTLVYSIFFLSEAIRTDLVGELNDTNYCQVIVNDLTNQMSKDYVNVARLDAANYYLDIEATDANGNSQAIRSRNNIDWYMLPNMGELRHFYYAEDQGRINDVWYGDNNMQAPPSYASDVRKLPGINANLLPIISIMHYRFTDEINYTQWYTAKAYAYYMFVQTHNVCSYDYEMLDDCAPEALYKMENGQSISWSPSLKTLVRPEEICSNVYVHGYDPTMNIEANKARANSQDALNLALSLLNLPYSFDASTYGVFREQYSVDENGVVSALNNKPSDSLGECDRWMPVQAGTVEGTDIASNDVDNYCGKLNHIHMHSSADNSCWGLTCEIEEHTHDGENCNTEGCGHTHDSSCCSKAEHTSHTSSCTSYDHYGGCGGDGTHINGCDGCWTQYTVWSCGGLHTHGIGCDTQNCGHIHSASCCSKTEHTHTPSPVEGYMSAEDNDYYAGENTTTCWTLTCEKNAHMHANWQWSDEEQKEVGGCWKTAYICLGHCGGHITPLIDINVNMEFESMAEKDFFKNVYWLSSGSFSVDMNKIHSLADWNEAWWDVMTTWFLPFPNSPMDVLENFGRGFLNFGAHLIDGVTNGLADLISGGDGKGNGTASEEDLNNAINAEGDEELEDNFDFDGWYDENRKIKKDYLQDLEDIYGTPDNFYQQGEIEWRDSFDVTFPLGGTRPLLNDEIKSLLEQLNPGLSESRKAVVEYAMNSVGDFWYDLSNRTQTADATKGRIDASGFVSSVLKHSIGWNHDWNECDFALNSNVFDHNLNSLVSGDILSVSRTNIWDPMNGWSEDNPNHVVIYLGYFNEGLPEYDECEEAGHYIIDCSFNTNGSVIRRIKDNVAYTYNYVYRGCY